MLDEADAAKVPAAKVAATAADVAAIPVIAKPGSSASSAKSDSDLGGVKVTSKLQSLVMGKFTVVKIVDNPAHIKSCVRLRALIDQAGNADSPVQLEAICQEFEEAKTVLVQLVGSCAKAAKSLKDHIGVVANAEKLAKVKREREGFARELKQLRDSAKKARVDVKEAEKSAVARGVFAVDFNVLLADNKHSQVAEVACGERFPSCDEPAKVKGGNADIEAWKALPKIQVLLGNFGGTYKSSESNKDTGSSQVVVYVGEGREETIPVHEKVLLKGVTAELRSEPPDCVATFFSTPWVYGFDPKFKSVAFCSNGVAQTRILISGQVKILMFEISSLIDILRAATKNEVVTMDCVKTEIEKASSDTLLRWLMRGAKIKFAIHNANEVLYTPAGWVTAECVTKGVLIYGSRMSWLVKSERAVQNYEEYMGIIQPNVERKKKMEEILEKLTLKQ